MGAETNNQREPSVAHTTAIVTTAQTALAASGSALTVYQDTVPARPVFPYVVFWSTPATPTPAGERLAGWGGDVTTVTQATVAGLTPTDVVGAVDRLTTVLHRRRPVIAGRRVGDVELDGAAGRAEKDPAQSPDGRQVWSAFLFFRLQSSPTSNHREGE